MKHPLSGFLAFKLVLCLSLFTGCATVEPGNDPVVVNAERNTRLAADTFTLLVNVEKQQRPTLQKVNPSLALTLKHQADKIRLHGKEWLQSARVLTQQYKNNRAADKDGHMRANLQTALATLTAATTEAQKYLAQVNATAALPSPSPALTPTVSP